MGLRRIISTILPHPDRTAGSYYKGSSVQPKADYGATAKLLCHFQSRHYVVMTRVLDITPFGFTSEYHSQPKLSKYFS